MTVNVDVKNLRAKRALTWATRYSIPRRHGSALSLTIALGGFLRWYQLDGMSLWGDEATGIAFATGHAAPLAAGPGTVHSADDLGDLLQMRRGYYSQHVFELLRWEIHPPLYVVLLNLWMHLWGTSVLAVRSLSVVANVASIPLVYILGRQLFSGGTGLCAALLFALAPFQIAYAQEARPYALMVLFSLASTVIAVRLCERDTRWSWGWLAWYAATAAGGLFVHYFFVWNVVFQTIFVGWRHRHNPPALRQWGIMLVCVAGVFAVWVPVLWDQLRSTWVTLGAGTHVEGPLPVWTAAVWTARSLAVFLSVGRIMGLCSTGAGMACLPDSLVTMVFDTVPAALLLLCVWRVGVNRGWWLKEGRADSGYGVCVLWGAIVVGGTLLLDLALDRQTIKVPRYVISASAPVYLAVAAGVMALALAVRRWVVPALVVFFMVGNGLYFGGFTTTKFAPRIQEAATYLDREARLDDLVFVHGAGGTLLSLAYHLESDLRLVGLRSVTQLSAVATEPAIS
jgi:4-amino-4-deoxy-L-arabinose transferase-like glycosyltransferase